MDAIGKKGRPDLVLLQEVPDEGFLLGIGRGLELEHHIFGVYTAGGGGYGLGILSSRELVNAEMHLLKPHGHAVLTAEMGVEGKRLLVCSVHLERVGEVEKGKGGFELSWGTAFQILRTEMVSETPRSMAVDEILKLPALMGPGETIIGGDFNTVPFSTAIRGMGRRYGDALWPTVDYFTGTYTMVKFPFRPRIDYIFHSGGVKVDSAGVIQAGGGDHLPVWAEFGF